MFSYLKYSHHGKAWWEWEPEYKNRDSAALKKVAQEHNRELDFQKWLQWQLYVQFADIKAYAAGKSVLLKGDLPILVSRDSADVWSHPDYFKLDFVAGAPPDMYCAKGQRWGTPTYEWDRIFADGKAGGTVCVAVMVGGTVVGVGVRGSSVNTLQLIAARVRISTYRSRAFGIAVRVRGLIGAILPRTRQCRG